MPSTAIQSRIAAFEAQGRQQHVPQPPPRSLPHKSSLIDLNDWVLDDIPPSIDLNAPTQTQRPKPKPKPKPLALQLKPAGSTARTLPLHPTPNTSVKKESDISWLYPPLARMEAVNGERGLRGNHVSGSSVSSFHSVSLSSDTDPGTPNSVANMIATYPIDRAPSSNSSLTESFENISIPPPLPHRQPQAHVPPQTHAQTPIQTPLPYVPRKVPPPPPSRASDRSSIQSSTCSSQSRSSSSSVQTPTVTTALPLPPSTSVLSPTIAKTKRPTPVPSAARKRYHSLFSANVIQYRRVEILKKQTRPPLLSYGEAKRTRQAAGWRGLSVDLITALPDETISNDDNKNHSPVFPQVDETVGPDDRLEGSIVKLIWSRSRVDKPKLIDIWNECDPNGIGSLDLEGFIRGMWRIDEHLRRLQSQAYALRNASSTSLSSLRNSLGSLTVKPGLTGLHRSTSRSSLGTSISRSSSVGGRHPVYSEYPPPPPIPKIVLR